MMSTRIATWRRGKRASFRSDCRGFTLVEVITALGVISVAAFILVSLFSTSYSLVIDNRQVRVALSLAEERLTDITTNPELYDWPAFQEDEFGPVTPLNPALAPETFSPPDALPAEPPAGRRETEFYSGFSWEAYARLPEPTAEYIEVVVAVEWQGRGRPRKFTLTSATPRLREGDRS